MPFLLDLLPTGLARIVRGGLLSICLLNVALGTSALAVEPLPQPEGRVILTISGAIENTNGDRVARFDRAMLERIGITEINTSASWTDGVSRFEGVLARDLLKAVGATGNQVSARALNDYAIEIPFSDFDSYDVLFAFKMDDVELTPRDKGPLWIIYPRDEYPELRNQRVDAKWLWQLVSLDVQ